MVCALLVTTCECDFFLSSLSFCRRVKSPYNDAGVSSGAMLWCVAWVEAELAALKGRTDLAEATAAAERAARRAAEARERAAALEADISS